MAFLALFLGLAGSGYCTNVYCCLVRAGKMDDEMDEAFRKLNEKRKDETKLWQGEDQE